MAHDSDDELWHYNALDCVRTRECGEVEAESIISMKLQEVDRFQNSMFYPVLRAMNIGLRTDPAARQELASEIQEAISEREDFLTSVLGHTLNINSHPQMTKLFYEDLAQPAIKTRPKKGIPGHLTCDDEALMRIGAREPLLRPIVNAIADIRTLGIFLKSFVLASSDYDGRMRCSFNICGTKTYRLSSSKNAFGSGMNLMTVPSDKSKSVNKAKNRASSSLISDFTLPNIRKLFIPDSGFTFFDLDLDRADLYGFVWEIGDELYKAMLRRGVDAHLFHVYLLDGQEPPALEELVESHPKYWDHRTPRAAKREFSKVFCHATDYCGQSRTVAAHTGRSIHEIDKAQKTYLGAHPKIEPYWKRLQDQINKRGFVENRFGFRWHIFDRRDQVLPEAVAWIPQSTTGIVINKIWKNFHEAEPEIQTLLQVHDSLGGQFPTHRREYLVPRMKELSRISVPYDDPLVIPAGIETSTTSWGECK